ncbi:hypothetical protein, partial [Pseudomonas viridiflava]|uniref:hypothetical protein n=1 Tax=Pseudomonas viridiflava TaxID=33069 RepID=UPI00197F5CD3
HLEKAAHIHSAEKSRKGLGIFHETNGIPLIVEQSDGRSSPDKFVERRPEKAQALHRRCPQTGRQALLQTTAGKILETSTKAPGQVNRAPMLLAYCPQCLHHVASLLCIVQVGTVFA